MPPTGTNVDSVSLIVCLNCIKDRQLKAVYSRTSFLGKKVCNTQANSTICNHRFENTEDRMSCWQIYNILSFSILHPSPFSIIPTLYLAKEAKSCTKKCLLYTHLLPQSSFLFLFLIYSLPIQLRSPQPYATNFLSTPLVFLFNNMLNCKIFCTFVGRVAKASKYQRFMVPQEKI